MSLPELIVTGLQEGCGIPEQQAKELAKKLITWGAKNGQSGVEHYWPCRFRELTPAQRDEAIRKEFNGQNLQHVCKKFSVSHTTVYKAVRT